MGFNSGFKGLTMNHDARNHVFKKKERLIVSFITLICFSFAAMYLSQPNFLQLLPALVLTMANHFFSPFGAAAPSRPWSPQSRGF